MLLKLILPTLKISMSRLICECSFSYILYRLMISGKECAFTWRRICDGGYFGCEDETPTMVFVAIG